MSYFIHINIIYNKICLCSTIYIAKKYIFVKSNQSKIKHIVCDSKHTKKSKATQTKTRKYPEWGTSKKMSYGEKINT